MDILNSTSDSKLYSLATPGLFVAVLNRSRDVIVRVTINWPLENLAWLGRRGHILLSWNDTRVLNQRFQAELKVEFASSTFGRDVLLPCDVDFSNSFWVSTANHLVIRFPKLVHEMRIGLLPRSISDETWVEVEVPVQLVEYSE